MSMNTVSEVFMMSVNCQWFQGTPLADHKTGLMLEPIKRFNLNPGIFISDKITVIRDHR